MSDCKSSCCEDIITLHAALIHAASEIQFALDYDNNGLPASITDIGVNNVQQVLEKYFSKLGIPVLHEIPAGDIGCPGDNTFTTEFEYIPGSLQVVRDHARPRGETGLHPGL